MGLENTTIARIKKEATNLGIINLEIMSITYVKIK